MYPRTAQHVPLGTDDLGGEGLLWSLFPAVDLSYYHHIHSELSTLVGAKERGGQTMGLGLLCRHFYMVEIEVKWVWGVTFKENRGWECWNKGNLQLEKWVWTGQEWSRVSHLYRCRAGGERVNSHQGHPSCSTALAANFLCCSSSCDPPSLSPVLPCSPESALPVSPVMALPCDGETVSGWEECWTHCGAPWWTCIWDEGTDGNLSRFLHRSEGASPQIILGWDSAEEREKRFLLFTRF